MGSNADGEVSILLRRLFLFFFPSLEKISLLGWKVLARENSISVATAKYDVVGDAEDSPEKDAPPLPPFPQRLQSAGPVFVSHSFVEKVPPSSFSRTTRNLPIENGEWIVAESHSRVPAPESTSLHRKRAFSGPQEMLLQAANSCGEGYRFNTIHESVAGIVSYRLRCVNR